MIVKKCGLYEWRFENGSVGVWKANKCLYYNNRPIYVSVKDLSAVSYFNDIPYDSVSDDGGVVICVGEYVSNNGSRLNVTDEYRVCDEQMCIHRSVKVLCASERDLGFQTKIGLWTKESEEVEDYNYFMPGEWYKHNEYAAEYAMGKDMTEQYFWRKETYCGLPMFAMQNIASGETICISRDKADVGLGTTDRVTESENFVDPNATVGALGISKPKPETILYTYYGAKLSKEIDASTDGLSVDYIYPGTNGVNRTQRGGKSFMRVNHPMKEGFVSEYSVRIFTSSYVNYREMMKATWRTVYDRLKDDLANIDNKLLYDNNMLFLKKVTNEYSKGVWGTPFAAMLPQFDPNSTSAEMGFVGQQTGIGYQLIRYGMINNDIEAVTKGKGIVDFWVNTTMTETGCPKVWYQLGLGQFEPQPQFTRQLGDGLEGILDAYVYLHNQGEEHEAWLTYCMQTADWLCAHQNDDGSYYRSYNYDGSMCMDSKANTPCVVRFLLEMYLVTGKEKYKKAAVAAGDWTYENLYLNMEYRGGTCDNSDIQDKEAGIYALFAFLALYDVIKDERFLTAAKGAADYVETFTYIWNFPVVTNFPTMPFNHNHISGQSHIVVGMGGADVYMACGGYVYYRLYLYTGDPHYLDYARFIYINSKQANDIDGSMGAAIPGLVHESGFFCEQIYRGNYHWLPWCTFVEVDPVSRMVDTFGVYEIDDAEKLSLDERVRKNNIYKDWYK